MGEAHRGAGHPVTTLLLFATPGGPLLLACLWPLVRAKAGLRFAPLAALPGFVLALSTFAGDAGTAGIRVEHAFLGLELAVDATARAFLLLTSALWMASGAFAHRYHMDDPRADAFFWFFALTMAGSLGLVVSADLLSFYLFFSLMTFSVYGLVVHRKDADALRAGRIYIVLAMIGEGAFLGGLVALSAVADGVPSWGEDVERAWALAAAQPGFAAEPIAFLLVAGLGVKAGLVPLHVWLPLAHPAAPTAASALLSGAIVKAGVLGWLRLLPTGTSIPDAAATLIVAGAAASVWGVLAGLPQREPKTILAYSSVSQMGYAALGVGLASYAPLSSAPALAAVILFAVHHGMAKGALFLAVGVADRCGGMRGVRNLLLAASALPALALAGAPLSTGALVKGTLEEAAASMGSSWHGLSHAFFFATALGTTLLMIRFLVALASQTAEHPNRETDERPSLGLLAPWLALVAGSALGVLWLGRMAPIPAGAPVSLALGNLADAAYPVLLGIGIGWGVLRASRLDPLLARVRIPPGDVLFLTERASALLTRARTGSLVRGVPSWGRRLAEFAVDRARSAAAAVTASERYLSSGAVAGAMLAAIGFAIALASLVG